jgi:hypothetical protein
MPTGDILQRQPAAAGIIPRGERRDYADVEKRPRVKRREPKAGRAGAFAGQVCTLNDMTAALDGKCQLFVPTLLL